MLRLLTWLLHVILLTIAPAPVESGWASRYDEGVMAATVAARQEWGQLPQDLTGWDAFIAVADCDHIGDTVWIWFDGLDDWQRALVTDCARRDGTDGALQWMRENSILYEVGWATAERGDFTCLCSRRALMSWAPPARYTLGLRPGS